MTSWMFTSLPFSSVFSETRCMLQLAHRRSGVPGDRARSSPEDAGEDLLQVSRII